MKYFVTILVLLGIILSAHAQLTSDDLLKISEIVKASETQMKAEIKASETRMKEYVDLKIDPLVKNTNAQFQHVSGKINILTAIVCALIGLIGVIIALPTWRDRKDRKFEKHLEQQVETLTQEIEALKKQQMKSPF